MATTDLIGSRVDCSSAPVRGSVDRAFGVGVSDRASAALTAEALAVASADVALRDVGLQAAGALPGDAALPGAAVLRGGAASMVEAGVASTVAAEAMAAAGDTGNRRGIRNALRLSWMA